MAGLPLPASGFPVDDPLAGLPMDLGQVTPGTPTGSAMAAPPAPQSQPGAEAIIAPASAAGDDLFAQLGVPRSEIAKLADARGKAQLASNAAVDALQGTAAERGALREKIGAMQSPDAPQLEEAPEAPTAPERTNTLRVFGQFLPLMGILGGLVIKNNSTAALKAASAAMQAAKDNDAEALKTANEQFELSMKAVLAKNERAQQIFQNASSLFKTDIDQALAQINALAGEEQNPMLQAQLAQGDVKGISDMMALRMGAWEKLNDAFLKSQEVNAKNLISAQQSFGDITKMRQEYQRNTETDYKVVQAAKQMATLVAHAKETDSPGPADLASIYSFMKVLDPPSTVREGEVANASNAAGVPDTIRNTYNLYLRGGKLPPKIRDEFVATTAAIARNSEERISNWERQYRTLSGAYGFDPSQVIVGPFAAPESTPGASQAGAPSDLPDPAANANMRARDPQTNETWVSDGRAWRRVN